MSAVARCKLCGAEDDFAAWYPVPERQGIINIRPGEDDDGKLRYDYDGFTKSSDPGEDEEFECSSCGALEGRLKDLVELVEEDDE